MTRKQWMLIIFFIVLAFWTFLAWGAYEVINRLPALASAVQSGVGNFSEPVFNWLPKGWLDAGFYLLLPASENLKGYYSVIFNRAGYIIVFIWGIGALVILAFTSLVRSYLP